MSLRTRGEAGLRLEAERRRIYHDLFENGFGGILQPGWRDERLTEWDVVLRALRGEPDDVAVVQNAISYWSEVVSPQLRSLTDSVSRVFGFVTSPEWDEDLRDVERASEKIRELLPSDKDTVKGLPDAETRAAVFWEACDRVARFLTDLRVRSSEYFLRWDPDGPRVLET